MKAKAQFVTNFEAKFLSENLLFSTICLKTHTYNILTRDSERLIDTFSSYYKHTFVKKNKISCISANLTQRNEVAYGIVPKHYPHEACREGIVPEHYPHATCRKELFGNITPMQLAGRNCSGTILSCSLQEGIVRKQSSHAACRKVLFGNNPPKQSENRLLERYKAFIIHFFLTLKIILT